MDIQQTITYRKWFKSLRDHRARARIDIRLRRLTLGNSGDVQPVHSGISELRIHYGPGYRVYYKQLNADTLILLTGGTKATQKKDIITAATLANSL